MFGLSKIPEYIILSTELTGFGGDPSLGEYPDSVIYDYVRVYQPKADTIKNYDTTFISANADTYTYDASKSTNYGTSKSLISKFGGGTAPETLSSAIGYNRRTYLKFATSSLKSIQSVNKVYVRMRYYNKDVVDVQKGIKISLSRLATWKENGITWNSQNTDAGAIDSLSYILDDGFAKATTVPNPITDSFINSYSHYVYLDVTDTITKMLSSNSLPDTLSFVLQGFSLGSGTQQYNTGYTYFSKEFLNSEGKSADSLSPSLVIVALESTETPIKSSLLTAKENSNSISLSWSTYSESNSGYFIIERSSDGKVFNVLSTIKAKGNSNVTVPYTFEDSNPLSGENYYCWREIDADGIQSNVSNIVKILYDKTNFATIYPNPVNSGNSLTIKLNDEPGNNIFLRITDLQGHIIHSEKIKPVGKNITVSTNSIQKGIYFINLYDENNKIIPALKSSKVIVN